METTTELNHTAQVEEIPLAQSGTTSCLKGVRWRHWSSSRADCTARGRFEWITNNQSGW